MEILRNLLLGLGDSIDRIGSKIDAMYTRIEGIPILTVPLQIARL